MIGVPIVIGLMLFAFLAPNFSSGPQGVPVAVAGPEQMVKHMTEKAGEDGPDLRVYESDADVRDAIENRDVVGGLVITPAGAQTYTASGNGAAYTEMVNQLGKSFEAQGMEISTEDLAPTSEEDPQAKGIGLLGLPLAFGGIVSAVIATFVFRRRKWVKFVVLVGIAAGGIARGHVDAAHCVRHVNWQFRYGMVGHRTGYSVHLIAHGRPSCGDRYRRCGNWRGAYYLPWQPTLGPSHRTMVAS